MAKSISNAIEVQNLSKDYGKVQALQKVNFAVQPGELFGLIGPDGAGKTTLFRLLTTLLQPTEGTAVVDGMDIVQDWQKIRASVGYMPGRFSLYQDLTVEENLNFFASAFGVTVQENFELIRPIFKQLEPFMKRRAGKLSGGMKQKLALSCALIHNPRVLFLDEPTTGVDAVSRTEFWDMLLHLKELGMTILVSTPYMNEASICDRVALMNNGQILMVDTPAHIVEQHQSTLYAVQAPDMYDLLLKVRQAPGVVQAYPFGAFHHMVVNADFTEQAFAAYCQTQALENVSLERIPADIEDVFIQLMQ